MLDSGHWHWTTINQILCGSLYKVIGLYPTIRRNNLSCCCCDVGVCLGMWWKQGRLRHILHRSTSKSPSQSHTLHTKLSRTVWRGFSSWVHILPRIPYLSQKIMTGCGEILKISLNFLKSPISSFFFQVIHSAPPLEDYRNINPYLTSHKLSSVLLLVSLHNWLVRGSLL